MDSNPYDPPRAKVSESVPPIERPKAVKAVVFLSFAHLIIGTAWEFWASRQAGMQSDPGFDLARDGFGVLLLAFLYFKLGRGRHWALSIYTVLCVIAVVGAPAFYFLVKTDWNVAKVMVGVLVNAVCLVLLYTGRSRVWFDRMRLEAGT